LSAVSYNPFLIGLGLDEDTAAFIGPDNIFTVEGSGAITVIDPSKVKHSSMAEADPGAALTLVNIKMHFLAAGGRFDIESREAILD
jgi:cyanophycinase